VNKKEFFAIVIVVCFFTVLINIPIVMYLSDDIAKVLGYLITLTVLPFAVATIPSTAILYATNAEFSPKQKVWLYLSPQLLIGCILCYYYLMLTYGGPL
jgi:hypothetical protein